MRSARFTIPSFKALGVAAWLSAEAMPVLAQEGGNTVDTTRTTSGGKLIPFPIIFYQPETGTGFGASVVYLFTLGDGTRGEDRGQSLRSSVSVTAIYTTKQQIITSIGAETYPGGGRYRALAGISYERFPTSLWGIGNDTPETNEEDYTPDQIGASGEFSVEVARHMYAGVFGQGGNRRLREIKEGGLIATGAVPGTEDGALVTLGLLLTRDSRSSNMYPRSGEYHQLRASRSVDVSGNDNDYSTFSLDLRTYVPIGSGVMALRALGTVSGDVPPFDLMPRLGGESLLRGYFGGRFRDRSLGALEVEYRSPMWLRTRTVLFAGTGQVADAPGDMRFDALHASAGFGFRILLNRAEEFSLRVDFGSGFDVESSGLYIGLNQAF